MEDLVSKIYQVMGIMICESKVSRKYGTAHKLSYADITLLKCVDHYRGARAGDLSRYMGITNGAVTQFAKKLEAKGYLYPYQNEDNKKEVYYRLTEAGMIACKGYEAYYSKSRKLLEDYVRNLECDVREKISGLLDVLLQSIDVHDHCSMKHDNIAKSVMEDTPEEKNGRCEKCKRIY